MKRVRKIVLFILITLTVLYAGIGTYRKSAVSMENFIAIANGEAGDCMAAWYQKDQTVIGQVDTEGRIRRFISYDTIAGDKMYSIREIAAGTGGIVYVLREQEDAYDGSAIEQQLVVYDFSGFKAKEVKRFSLKNEEENYRYRWMNVAGETVTLIATDLYESHAIRRTYEYGSLRSGTLNEKNTRIYPLKTEEGIYKAAANSTDLVYISNSGKIFRSTEEETKEVYPARELDSLIYPTFLAYAQTGSEYFEEHESGDIIELDLATGAEKKVQSGNSSFTGVSTFTSKDIVRMSMTSINSYTAVVDNVQTGEYNILITRDGNTTCISSLQYTIQMLLFRFAGELIFSLFIAGIILLLTAAFFTGMRKGQTILSRLLCVAVPLVAVGMSLFGVIAYNYYRSAIEENFKKQTVDEGNMLTALFGQESFNEIEYPYDYTGEAYQYLKGQLNTRKLYARILYYESGDVYIGVDRENPCFYPVDILLNQTAKKLYQQAALTGESVTGRISDQKGERVVCITPVGGVSGQTVYLMETGIFVSNIDAYMQSYLKNFTILCVAFLIIILVLMSVAFYNVLIPIGEIRQIMKLFVDGDAKARITLSSQDELSGISRMFNKMADDSVLVQHNMEKLTETYYKFVPAGLLGLLGEENLFDVTVGSRTTGSYLLVKVILTMARCDVTEEETYADKFFEILNQAAVEHQLVPIPDQGNLYTQLLIRKDGMKEILDFVLAVLARVDAENASAESSKQMGILFVILRTQVSLSIGGDENRYIPAVFAPQMQQIMKQEELLRRLGSRILVEKSAYEELDGTYLYAYRYVAAITDREDKISFYDIYSDRSSEAMRRFMQTQEIFDQALKLYETGQYYEAKNLFSIVLRENEEDFAARHYIFLCEAEK